MSIPTNASTPPLSPFMTAAERPESSSHLDEGGGVAEGDAAGAEEPGFDRDLLLDAVRDARQIIRLIQCPKCSDILEKPTTLPCGYSICGGCVPVTRPRANVSWPATANRLQGFTCPIPDCAKEHAAADCGFDVTLNNVLGAIKNSIKPVIQSATDSVEYSTYITVCDSWAAAGVSSLQEKEPEPKLLQGGRIRATYELAGLGGLEYHSDVSYMNSDVSEEEAAKKDTELFLELKESVRSEMDCQVCYALFLDPVTTACGHTYCRSCLHRILDHSDLCAICRRSISIQAQVDPRSAPSNKCLVSMIDGFWADLVARRSHAYKLEQELNYGGFDTPIFVCTLAFPSMPMFLHVFEPRYRLMIRRAMQGNRTFGMVPARPLPGPDNPPFMELGVLLRIVNIEVFPDGRSLLETVGVSRFRITRYGCLDGYVVANTEKVDDISLAEEEALEALEVGQGSRSLDPATAIPSSPVIQSISDLDSVPTREMVEFSIAFVRRMQGKSVDWLASRMLTIYGECPTDAATFPWWLACVLPVRDAEKYRLLATSSVRERLKICCRWILEWEDSSWLVPYLLS
ncbi:ATP-dependent protease La domain-containing protein [Poronia punctata]|nr:ATP-dependent protease La domain-containing protein [Poronia punctata]